MHPLSNDGAIYPSLDQWLHNIPEGGNTKRLLSVYEHSHRQFFLFEHHIQSPAYKQTGALGLFQQTYAPDARWAACSDSRFTDAPRPLCFYLRALQKSSAGRRIDVLVWKLAYVPSPVFGSYTTSSASTPWWKNTSRVIEARTFPIKHTESPGDPPFGGGLGRSHLDSM